MTSRVWVLVLAAILMACSQPKTDEDPNADFNLGMERGYEHALDHVEECLDDPGVETPELGTCLSAKASSLTSDPSDEYLEGVELSGLRIELILLDR